MSGLHPGIQLAAVTGLTVAGRFGLRTAIAYISSSNALASIRSPVSKRNVLLD